MAKKNRGQNITYLTHRYNRKTDKYSQITVFEDGSIFLSHRVHETYKTIILDRKHARLLAKRILQALEDTK